jgi:hypothetical protein
MLGAGFISYSEHVKKPPGVDPDMASVSRPAAP